MLKKNAGRTQLLPRKQRGAGLLEVLITIVLTSFGLLALAVLQTRMTQTQAESLQRGQALTVLSNMTQLMTVNAALASTYVSTTTIGTGDSQPTNCATLTTPTIAATDVCEWSNSLKGAAERSGANNVAAMIGARGCIEVIQTADLAICRPAVYRVTVAWQGLSSTTAPNLTCAQGLYGSSDDVRRTLSSQVVTPLPACS